MRHVRVLAGRIGPRTAGSAAYRRATRYVSRTFEAVRWRSEVDPFRLPQGGRTANVIATWGRGGARSVVIGAHLDTVEASPGANDNASGVAVLLELARVFSGTRFARGVTFVAFGAEELQPDGSHHLGSLRFVRQVRNRRRPAVVAMASVDMIGKDAPLVVGWLGRGRRAMVGTVLRAAGTADVPAVERVLEDVSDNGPFEKAGIPAALLWTGLEPNYHSPTDVVSNVDVGALRNVGDVLIGAVRRLLRR